MQIHRYLNGKPITRKELSHLELQTDALKSAVLDARRRVEQGMNGVEASGATGGQVLFAVPGEERRLFPGAPEAQEGSSVTGERQGLFSAAGGERSPMQHEA